MKVLLVSRWGVQCGIATYTDQLSLALIELGIDVEIAAEQYIGIKKINVQTKDVTVHRCWNGRKSSFTGIVNLVKKINPDAVHIQHEFGFMDEARTMIDLVSKTRPYAAIVVTPHTVIPHPSAKSWFYRSVLDKVGGVVAHNKAMAHALVDWKIPENNVFVIPHGTPSNCIKKDKKESRRRLYLPEDPSVIIAMSLGFITPGKMQYEAVEAIIYLVQEGVLDSKRFLYLIVGEPGQKDEQNIEYCRKIHELIDKHRSWNYVRIIPRFVDREDLPYYYGAADFAITGSCQTFYSVSGRSHQEMAFGMPSVSSDVRLLSDLNEHQTMKYKTLYQLRSHILTLARSSEYRSILSRRCTEVANETLWPNVAARHIKMYEAVIARMVSRKI